MVTEVDPPEHKRLAAWIDFWRAWSAAELLRSYLAETEASHMVPRSPAAIQTLIDLYFAERCATALDHELENQPAAALFSLQQMERFLGA